MTNKLYIVEFWNEKFNTMEQLNKLSFNEAEKTALNLFHSGWKCINIYESIEKTQTLFFLGDKK